MQRYALGVWLWVDAGLRVVHSRLQVSYSMEDTGIGLSLEEHSTLITTKMISLLVDFVMLA